MSATDAIALKDEGNKAFKEHDWPRALELYTKAIEAKDDEATFYTNRAQVSTTNGCDRRRVFALTPIPLYVDSF